MKMNTNKFSIRTFIMEIFRGVLLVFAGFAIAPTHLLYSFYEAHTLFKGAAIFIGILTAVWGLFYMLKISLRAIEKRTA
jgi:hypothetical protein